MCQTSFRLPFAVRLIIFLQAFLGAAAITGGIGMLIAPSGGLLHLSHAAMNWGIFPDFLIPGILLILINGMLPLLVVWGLSKKTRWAAADKLRINKRLHWAWNFSFYTGAILILWISIQIQILQFVAAAHIFHLMFGTLIITVTFLPSVRRHYAIFK